MLAGCGVNSPEELFDHLPEAVRLNRPLALAPGISEYEIVQYFRDRAAENSNGYASFLGAGVYSHYRPVLVDTVVSRGEFLTSYTPYQAEIAQGTLTTIFEFQTMICQLTGMDVANASMYDGSTATPEAVSLGILEPPTDADIVAGELQSFAIPPSYGGPYAGIIAAKEKFLRQMPGRLVGETKDSRGNRAFCLTLATREQHIRREKATSNICTNQALIALMATVFMTVYGKQGLRELAEQNLAKSHYLATKLKPRFTGKFFNEFVVKAEG